MKPKHALALAGGIALASWGISKAFAGDFSFAGKVCLITGGSRGLGLVMARQICAEGGRVALLARDLAELQRAHDDLIEHGGEVVIVPCDLLDRGQTEETLRHVVRHFGGIDVLINNAGIIEVGALEHMKREDFERALDLHFWAPFNLMWEVIPEMRRRGAGRIINIASIGGKIAVPHLAPYCASKFALVGLSDSMRAELARDGIYLTTVAPGLMRTGSHLQAKFKGRHAAEFAWFSLSNSMPGISMKAERAAAQILEACRRGRPELTLTLRGARGRDRKRNLSEPDRPRDEAGEPNPSASDRFLRQRDAVRQREPIERRRSGVANATLRSGSGAEQRNGQRWFALMSGNRLFVALQVPETIAALLVRLNPNLPGVRWLQPEQIHLSLSFLGQVEASIEEVLCEKLSAIRFSKFFLPVSGVGSFPAKGKPNVIWAGVGGGHPQLFHLHQRVQEAALAAGLEPDLRGWHPHFTIARCRDISAESIRPFLKANADFDAGLVRVESFALYSSVPGLGGSEYRKELEVPAR